MLNHETLFNKIQALIKETVTDQEIYEWALAQAVTDDYEQLVSEDPLVKSIFKTFLNVLQGKHRPPLKVLEYYQDCLNGQHKFTQETLRSVWGQSAPRLSKQEINEKKEKIKAFMAWDNRWFFIMRVYIFLFALFILGLHSMSLVQPEFLLVEDVPSRSEVLKDSLPHIIYALVLLVPFRIMVRGPLFLLSLPALLFGSYYYSKIAFAMLGKFSLNPFFIIFIMPFCALPALMALVLHFWAWRKYKAMVD